MEKMKSLDGKTQKTITMYGGLDLKSDVDRIYVSWRMGGTDLISCEGFIRIGESDLEWYAKNSVEPFIEGVRAVKTLEYNDIVTKNEFRET